MDKAVYDCIIIGGGISGISFAHYLKKSGKNILITEKRNRIGGQIQTENPATDPKYWFELGSHTCYNSYTNLLSIIKETENTELIQPLSKSKYVLYSSGKIKSIFSGVSKLSLLLNCWIYFYNNKDGKTVKNYFSPIVGPKNYDNLFKYAFRAVICQPADDYPAEIFLKRRTKRDKDLPRRFAIRGGLSSFLDAIIKKDNIEVKTNTEIVSIQKKEAYFLLKTKNGEVLQTYNVAIATNPQVSSSLLNESEHKLSERLSSIQLYYSDSLNVTISKEKVSLDSIAGIIPLNDDFLSVVSRDLIEDDKLRSFTFHFEKGRKTESEKKDLICKILNISQSDIIECATAEHELPAMQLNHLQMGEQVKYLKTDESIYVLGNYFYGLSLEDCVIRSKQEAERFLRTIRN